MDNKLKNKHQRDKISEKIYQKYEQRLLNAQKKVPVGDIVAVNDVWQQRAKMFTLISEYLEELVKNEQNAIQKQNAKASKAANILTRGDIMETPQEYQGTSSRSQYRPERKTKNKSVLQQEQKTLSLQHKERKILNSGSRASRVRNSAQVSDPNVQRKSRLQESLKSQKQMHVIDNTSQVQLMAKASRKIQNGKVDKQKREELLQPGKRASNVHTSIERNIADVQVPPTIKQQIGIHNTNKNKQKCDLSVTASIVNQRNQNQKLCHLRCSWPPTKSVQYTQALPLNLYDWLKPNARQCDSLTQGVSLTMGTEQTQNALTELSSPEVAEEMRDISQAQQDYAAIEQFYDFERPCQQGFSQPNSVQCSPAQNQLRAAVQRLCLEVGVERNNDNDQINQKIRQQQSNASPVTIISPNIGQNLRQRTAIDGNVRWSNPSFEHASRPQSSLTSQEQQSSFESGGYLKYKCEQIDRKRPFESPTDQQKRSVSLGEYANYTRRSSGHIRDQNESQLSSQNQSPSDHGLQQQHGHCIEKLYEQSIKDMDLIDENINQIERLSNNYSSQQSIAHKQSSQSNQSATRSSLVLRDALERLNKAIADNLQEQDQVVQKNSGDHGQSIPQARKIKVQNTDYDHYLPQQLKLTSTELINKQNEADQLVSNNFLSGDSIVLRREDSISELPIQGSNTTQNTDTLHSTQNRNNTGNTVGIELGQQPEIKLQGDQVLQQTEANAINQSESFSEHKQNNSCKNSFNNQSVDFYQSNLSTPNKIGPADALSRQSGALNSAPSTAEIRTSTPVSLVPTEDIKNSTEIPGKDPVQALYSLVKSGKIVFNETQVDTSPDSYSPEPVDNYGLDVQPTQQNDMNLQLQYFDGAAQPPGIGDPPSPKAAEAAYGKLQPTELVIEQRSLLREQKTQDSTILRLQNNILTNREESRSLQLSSSSTAANQQSFAGFENSDQLQPISMLLQGAKICQNQENINNDYTYQSTELRQPLLNALEKLREAGDVQAKYTSSGDYILQTNKNVDIQQQIKTVQGPVSDIPEHNEQYVEDVCELDNGQCSNSPSIDVELSQANTESKQFQQLTSKCKLSKISQNDQTLNYDEQQMTNMAARCIAGTVHSKQVSQSQSPQPIQEHTLNQIQFNQYIITENIVGQQQSQKQVQQNGSAQLHQEKCVEGKGDQSSELDLFQASMLRLEKQSSYLSQTIQELKVVMQQPQHDRQRLILQVKEQFQHLQHLLIDLGVSDTENEEKQQTKSPSSQYEEALKCSAQKLMQKYFKVLEILEQKSMSFQNQSSGQANKQTSTDLHQPKNSSYSIQNNSESCVAQIGASNTCSNSAQGSPLHTASPQQHGSRVCDTASQIISRGKRPQQYDIQIKQSTRISSHRLQPDFNFAESSNRQRLSSGALLRMENANNIKLSNKLTGQGPLQNTVKQALAHGQNIKQNNSGSGTDGKSFLQPPRKRLYSSDGKLIKDYNAYKNQQIMQ